MHLRGIGSTSLMFEGLDEASKVVGFVDSNFVGDLDKRRSLIGYLFIFGMG